MKNINILLCGVGGQGTVLTSRIIALAAMKQGREVSGAETIGMAQRGGSVVSHVRTGDGIHSPLIPKGKADIILAFEPGEAAGCLPYLKEDGCMVSCIKAVKPVTASLTGNGYDGREAIEYLQKSVKNLILIDGEKICEACGSDKVLNTVLLGSAVKSGKLEISKEEIVKAMKERIPDELMDMNLKAFKMGEEA